MFEFFKQKKKVSTKENEYPIRSILRDAYHVFLMREGIEMENEFTYDIYYQIFLFDGLFCKN